jgi:hypothetical protein
MDFNILFYYLKKKSESNDLEFIFHAFLDEIN